MKFCQLPFELEMHPGYEIVLLSLIIESLGVGMKQAMKEITKLINKNDLVQKIVPEMQKLILMKKYFQNSFKGMKNKKKRSGKKINADQAFEISRGFSYVNLLYTLKLINVDGYILWLGKLFEVFHCNNNNNNFEFYDGLLRR